MRKIKHISPTSISKFFEDRQEYYLKYLTDHRPPKEEQTEPMSVGSSFDSYVKSYLNKALFGRHDPEFELTTLFEKQVEPHNRDFALKAGKNCFEQYQYSGALADLMVELELAHGEPKFEFKLEKVIDGVNFLGYPDLYFVLPSGRIVIYDFKVNGYCAKSNTSPKKQFNICRDGWEGNQSRNHRKSHKDFMGMVVDGVVINISDTFENIEESWANQLAIYGWMIGAEVGSNFLVGIEQLCCYQGKVRVASHRNKISKQHQQQLLANAKELHRIIDSGHIFDDLSREESDAKCNYLDEMYKAYLEGADPMERWFVEVTR